MEAKREDALCVRRRTRNDRLVDGIIAGALGMVTSAAFSCSGEEVTLHIDVAFAVRAIVVASLLYALFRVLRRLLPRIDASDSLNGIVRFLVDSRGWFVSMGLVAGIFLLAWLPYVVCEFPGDLYMDSSVQIDWFLRYVNTHDPHSISLHHPLVDTIVFGSIANAVMQATGSFQLAVFFLVMLQAFCTAGAFALFVVFARRRWGASGLMIVLVIAFIAFVPLIPLIICTVSKDSFFSWAYVLFLVALVDIIRAGRRQEKPQTASFVLLVISSVVVCVTKNFGIYVAVPSLIALFFLAGGNLASRAKAVLPALAAALLAALLVFIVPKAFGLYSGGAEEMLSLPFQQTALTLIRHGDEMPESEKETIDKVLDVDTVAEDYMPANADGVKGFSPKGKNADYLRYITVWVAQGVRYPLDYLEAFLGLEAPLFAPTPLDQIFDSGHTHKSDYFPDDYAEKPPFNARASQGLRGFYDWFATVPFLSVLCMAFTYGVFVPFFLLAVVLSSRIRRPWVPIVVAVFVSLVGLMLSPIVAGHEESTRYYMPFVYSAPVLLVLAASLLQESKMEDRS